MSENDLGKAVVGERGRGLLCIIRLTVSSLMGAENEPRQQRHGKQLNGAESKRQAAASRHPEVRHR